MRKAVVITGATDGIGRALAISLAKDYDLVLCGRSEEKMQRLLQELNGRCVYHECFDITDDRKRHEFCKAAMAKLGHIDILINNAGANTKKDRITDIDLNDLRYMFELNCVSYLGTIQEFYPMMKEQGYGLIVNILSSCCLFHSPMAGSYTASKKAMEGISRILLKEVKSENIGVCNVYPGGVDTNFRVVPNHSYLKPETVAVMVKACIENEEGCVHDIVLRPFIEDNIG
ncbi:MAG: SDR family oxidoreductase [Oscillospiraceae bacterium]|nr:SDR family oxidoreductase [Oscillospiraceae bacterium]